MPRLRPTAFLTSLLLLSVVSIGYAERAGNQAAPITLQVDAREAPRRIFHAQLTIPATPGPLTLFYPKWITWLPIGPINNLVGLKIAAAGKVLPWRRDDLDMYAFHVDVPPSATALEVSLDYVSPSESPLPYFGPTATDQLLVLNWNLVTLYPAGKPTAELTYKPSLLLPEGWKLGTALPIRSELGGKVEFEPASLDTLIDSPVIAGAHYRVIPLAAPGLPPDEMDIAADSEAALAVPQTFVENCIRLMHETEAMFGAHHFRCYHFLVTLSDHCDWTIEHHESSVQSSPERSLLDTEIDKEVTYHFSHELVHSWNGKYRRPGGIATPDFQQSMKTELVWVYEGLTEYLGDVLAARSGFWTPERFRDSDAIFYVAEQEHRAGRTWRPLVDTAVSAPILFEHVFEREWTSWRRGVDFYFESALIWQEADVIIRQRSNGRRSLDDFCHAFFGAPSGPPMVKPYTFDDLVTALNEVTPYDWKGFFQKRVYDIARQVPLEGIEQAGWKLIFNAKPNDWEQSPLAGLRYSIGMTVQAGKDKDGTVLDVVPGMAAAEAGIAPGMKLVAVNGQPWSPEILLDALKAPGTPPRQELLVENAGHLRTYGLEYGGGPRHPHLERDPSRPDLLGEIIKPHALP